MIREDLLRSRHNRPPPKCRRNQRCVVPTLRNLRLYLKSLLEIRRIKTQDTKENFQRTLHCAVCRLGVLRVFLRDLDLVWSRFLGPRVARNRHVQIGLQRDKLTFPSIESVDTRENSLSVANDRTEGRYKGHETFCGQRSVVSTRQNERRHTQDKIQYGIVHGTLDFFRPPQVW